MTKDAKGGPGEPAALHFPPARPEDHGRLLDIWEAAVRPTHLFLTEADIEDLRPQVREAFAGVAELYLALDPQGVPAGFMGLTPPDGRNPARVEMLFVDPASHGQGLGTALLQMAQDKYSVLELEVNEGNASGADFYRRRGFEVKGRSERDLEGRPFPIVYLRRG